LGGLGVRRDTACEAGGLGLIPGPGKKRHCLPSRWPGCDSRSYVKCEKIAKGGWKAFGNYFVL
jgi:hypothetical protein